MSMDLDDFKVSLLSDNPLLKLPVKLLVACSHRREASLIYAPPLTINIDFLPDIFEYILGWRWENGIQRKVAAATMHTHLGASCVIGLLATVNVAKKCWVV